jgi:hypothetical protein
MFGRLLERSLTHIQGQNKKLKILRIQAANGLRYPLVGGTRQRCFDGASFKPHKVPENAQTPTSRVHAVLACDWMQYY